MPSTTYPDGFPQNPIEAIDFSYFLSEEEKADWKQWLESATQEQQFELVDTLHAMWQENQKSAIPNGFNQGEQQNSTQSNPQPAPVATQAPAPQIQPQNQASSQPAPEPIQEQPVSANPVSNQNQNNTAQADDFVTEEEELVTTPKILSEENQYQEEFGSETTEAEEPKKQDRNEQRKERPENKQERQDRPNNNNNRKNNNRNNQNQSQGQNQNQNNTNNASDNQSREQAKPYFNVTRLRESATKQELEKLYGEYSQLRETSFASTHSFYEAQGKFLDKVMAVVVNFEQVADFFDSISQKIIELNDRLVSEVKDFNTIKGNISSQQGDILDQLDHLRNDVDRLYRTTRDDKSYNRSKFEEINTQLASVGADTLYSGPGVQQRFDLITSKIHKLELELTRMKGEGMTASETPAAPSFPQNKPSTIGNGIKPLNPNGSTGKTNISIN